MVKLRKVTPCMDLINFPIVSKLPFVFCHPYPFFFKENVFTFVLVGVNLKGLILFFVPEL